MEAINLLRRAEAAGLRVSHEGDSLLVRGPKSIASLDLVEEIREHKVVLLAYLRGEGQSTIASKEILPEGTVRLLRRLRTGITWLTTTHQELIATAALHTVQEEHLLEMLDLWDHLEATLRFVYPEYRACVLGHAQRCPDQSPVSCRWCRGKQHAAAQVRT